MFVEENIDPIVEMGIGTTPTKKEFREYIQNKLSTDKNWVLKALLKIFEKQTDFEIDSEHTREHNRVGFTGHDAPLLTSFAKQYKSRGFLTAKQMMILHKKMPKYWMQIVKISNREKLEKMIRVYLAS